MEARLRMCGESSTWSWEGSGPDSDTLVGAQDGGVSLVGSLV